MMHAAPYSRRDYFVCRAGISNMILFHSQIDASAAIKLWLGFIGSGKNWRCDKRSEKTCDSEFHHHNPPLALVSAP
jgi:hypothetical protein